MCNSYTFSSPFGFCFWHFSFGLVTMLLLSPRCQRKSPAVESKRIGFLWSFWYLKKSSTQVLFLGPLIPLFWTSGDVRPGISKTEWIAYLHACLVCSDNRFLRFISGGTPADLLTDNRGPINLLTASKAVHSVTLEREIGQRQFPCLLSSNHLFYCQFFISHLFLYSNKKEEKIKENCSWGYKRKFCNEAETRLHSSLLHFHSLPLFPVPV